MLKKLLLFSFLLGLTNISFAQSKMNFHLAKKVYDNQTDIELQVPMLIQGDAFQIENLVNDIGGTFKFSTSIEKTAGTLLKLSAFCWSTGHSVWSRSQWSMHFRQNMCPWGQQTPSTITSLQMAHWSVSVLLIIFKDWIFAILSSLGYKWPGPLF